MRLGGETIGQRLRRLLAPRRIGCFYRLAASHTVPGFDVASWLPGKIMARFFQTS
jgi:hypothetical protein